MWQGLPAVPGRHVNVGLLRYRGARFLGVESSVEELCKI